MRLMLDPRQRLDKYTNGDVVVTKEPAEYPAHVAEKLLQFRRKGLPLVVEPEEEKVEEPLSLKPPAPLPSDNEEPSKPKGKRASDNE